MKIKNSIILILLTMNCSLIVSKVSYFPTKTQQKTNLQLQKNIEEKIIITDDKKKLNCIYVNNPKSKKILIYFQGNAGNIYQRIPELIKLSSFNINVLGVGYRGYGKSTGHPTENGLYRDGRSVFNYVNKEMNYLQDSVIIFGRSIGTTVAINVSMNKKLAGIILITPLTSGKEYAKVKGLGIFSGIARNAFDNLNKCKNLLSPTLIIHGTKDDVIPYFMGKEIFENIKGEKYFTKIEDGNHNNLEYVNPVLYWNSIDQFVNKKNKKNIE